MSVSESLISRCPQDRSPILALAQPGGRFPGVELPPTWFPDAGDAVVVPSALPGPRDREAIVEAVRSMSEAIRDAALQALAAGRHPQLIGGDHSLAIGSLAASVRHFGRVGVVWIDAHADFNTMESSPTGNPHGMPLSVACGLGDARLRGVFTGHVRPADVVLIAAREIDPEERDLLARHQVWCVSVEELRAQGVEALVQRIQQHLAGLPVHLSFDFDSLDQGHFRATGTPSEGGLMPQEAEQLLAEIGRRLPVIASDWVEFDPRHADAEPCARLARQLYTGFGRALDAQHAG
ncbi:MAG: arginase family protein [Candidatus Sericytochromatia bacterium]|nr:arginase family protein [Candidatus Sericytochromatia bacterium]